MKTSSSIPSVCRFLFLLPGLLLANPITSTEVPEEAVQEGVTFPQIFSLLAVLIVTQVVVVACIWVICLLARKVKDNAKLKTSFWQDDLPPSDQNKNDKVK